MLGVLKKTTGEFTWGFVLLAVFALIYLLVASRSGGRRTLTPAATAA